MKEFLVQKVSSPLCILLTALMAFWTVLYYFTHKAQAIGDNLAIEEEVLREIGSSSAKSSNDTTRSK